MTPPGSQTLTPKQEARRQRVIEAALALGAAGGYDAVQMRDVAATANVALGTIYRYFSSKDHLLAEAMAEWTGQLQARLAQRGPRGETAADQLVDVLRRASRALERQPRLAAALVQALSSSDSSVASSTARVNRQIRSIVLPILAELPDDVREGLIDIIRHVWYSSLVGWVNGRTDITHVGDELEKAARLVLRGYEPSRSGNGRRGR